MVKVIKRSRWVLLLILIVMVGCAQAPSDFMLASDSATQFMIATYEVDDYSGYDLSDMAELESITEEYVTRIEPFATQQGIDEYLGNRVRWGVVKAATVRGFNLAIGEVVLDAFNMEGDKAFMDYEVNLILTYDDGSSGNVKKNGKLQLLKVDGVWKINHEKSTSYPILLMQYEIPE